MRKLILLFPLLLALGCNRPSTYDSDASDEPIVAPVAPNAPLAPPVVTHNLLRSSYRIRAHIKVGIDHFVAGTGTGIDPSHIVTVAHVVCGAIFGHPEVPADFIRVDVFNDDAEFEYSIPAHVIKINVHEDLAELEVTGSPLPFYHELDYGQFSPGAPCYNIGAADGGIPFQIFHGRMSKDRVELSPLDGKEPNVFCMELAYAVHGGTSGGGVYTYDGKFIGVIDRGDEESTWIVRFDTIKRFLKE